MSGYSSGRVDVLTKNQSKWIAVFHVMANGPNGSIRLYRSANLVGAERFCYNYTGDATQLEVTKVWIKKV
jgi:hypothetical protein